MNIILVGKGGKTQSWHLSGRSRFLLALLLTAVPLTLGILSFWLSALLADQPVLNDGAHKEWLAKLRTQEDQLGRIKQEAHRELMALTVRLAEMQSRLTRLDALGERLVQTARLNNGEFDFSREPAIGGPDEQLPDASYRAPTIQEAIADLEALLEDRQTQLEVLSSLIKNRKLREATFIAGRPIKKGWMSSRFGRRADPFTGRLAWHAGVDFAGKEGSDIIAVAAGVVTEAAERYGYGLMVEINHGSGHSTRYAHCKALQVAVGDVVRKGQTVATMGSTGRSTGSHVHFEVYRNGRTVDPAAYIHRTHP